MSPRIGRFQVMALLQAARAYSLGMQEKLAKSWGLNRAIFYAAAKRGFKVRRMKRPAAGITRLRTTRRYPSKEEVFQIGDELAYRVKIRDGYYFTIGGEIQTDEDFDAQVASRFDDKYVAAWREALEIVSSYPKPTLQSQTEFFEKVYKPRRDELSKKWSEMLLSK